MTLIYLLTPFVAWFVTGVLKFLVNSLKARKLAVHWVGNGGFPSNHSAIVSCTTALIGLREGVEHPAFGVAITLAFIVMLDAATLRRQVGKQAERINQWQFETALPRLRERMGHSPWEIFAGILVGILVAVMMNQVVLF